VGIIDEVFNFGPIELYLHLRLLVNHGCKTVILLGDRSQREKSGIELEHPYLTRRIEMHTSLNLPRDAHALYVRFNNLDSSWYDTTSDIETSIFFTNDLPQPVHDMAFKMHGHAGSPDIALTIGKVQGARAVVAFFDADVSLRQASWLTD
jgi:hypothetical protein